MFFRKAILLIHGFAGGIWDYANVSNDLQRYIDFDVYSFTLPGHEKLIISKVKREDWIEASEKQVEKLIQNGYKTIYLVGHSMGGVIACNLARKYPQVKKLILAAPAFEYLSFKDDQLDLIGSIKKSKEIIKDHSLETVVSRAFKIPLSTALEFTKLIEEHHDDPKYITCPTLILQGTDDSVVPLKSSRYVHKVIKSKTNILIEYKGVNHDVFLSERYEDILKDLIFFLRHKNIITKTDIIKK